MSMQGRGCPGLTILIGLAARIVVVVVVWLCWHIVTVARGFWFMLSMFLAVQIIMCLTFGRNVQAESGGVLRL